MKTERQEGGSWEVAGAEGNVIMFLDLFLQIALNVRNN